MCLFYFICWLFLFYFLSCPNEHNDFCFPFSLFLKSYSAKLLPKCCCFFVLFSLCLLKEYQILSCDDKEFDAVTIATECYWGGGGGWVGVENKQTQKLHCLAFSWIVFCLLKMRGRLAVSQLTPTWDNLPQHGATYPDMGQLNPTWGNLLRHGATYSDMGQLTPT